MTCPQLAVLADPADDAALRDAAAQLAERLALPDATTGAQPPAGIDMLVLVTPRGLALHAIRGPEALTRGKPVRIDLQHLDTTTGHGRSLRQPLMRAVGLRKGDPHRPTLLDATAGFGEDAWLLACAGCRVRALERHPVIAALLADAIERAKAQPNAPDPAPMIDVIVADSRALLAELANARGSGAPDRNPVAHELPEVVYIDPMFNPGRKAAQRKAMLVLGALVGTDRDADALLEPARQAALRRVVVKRARRAPFLADTPPAASHTGRSVRYDVYPSAGPTSLTGES